MQCPHCESDQSVKNGLVNGGKQRYLCKSCGRNYTNQPRRKYPLSMRLRALVMYKEGLGIRAIGRILEVSNVTILRWIREIGNDLRSWYNDKLLAETQTEIPVLEIDEMWHFLKKNSRKSGFGLLIVVPPDGSSPSKWALVKPKH